MSVNTKRMTKAAARAILAKMPQHEIKSLEKEDAGYDFDIAQAAAIYRGPVMGRPQKAIKREVAAIRIPSDALEKI